ncbi:hypothetical protein, partial [Burkholderia ubonensis]|uniref:hypothetical protein n=1 Tax=Burkholderia ubonensis TaxID=101571 RepID=UPI001E5A271E
MRRRRRERSARPENSTGRSLDERGGHDRRIAGLEPNIDLEGVLGRETVTIGTQHVDIPPGRIGGAIPARSLLLDRHRLREIARLVDVGAARAGRVIREQ